MLTKSKAVESVSQNKFNKKQYRIPTESIKKIELFADVVYHVKKHLDPDYRKEQHTKLKNVLLMNGSLFWENFYTRAEYMYDKGVGGDAWQYSKYDDLRTLCGGEDITFDNVMFLMTDISEVTHNENSNRKVISQSSVGGKSARNIIKSMSKKCETPVGGISKFELSEWINQVSRNLKVKVDNKREYIEIDKDIIENIIVSLLPLYIEDGGLAFSPIQVFKNDTFTENGKYASETNNWNPNKYRIPEDVELTDVVGDLGLKISKPVSKRLTKIITDRVNTYGIGNHYCWGQFTFNTALVIPSDWESKLDNEDDIKRTQTIITNITDPTKYNVEYTDDRVYSPLNQLPKSVRNYIAVENYLGEVDLVSAQANMLVSLIVGDFKINELYSALKTNMSKKALKRAIKKVSNLTENQKEELRSYTGDFYQNIIDAFKLKFKRKTLKTQALTLFNCKNDEMWTMTELMEALNSSPALQAIITFLETLKEQDHKSAYQVLFKMESMIVRRAIDTVDYGVGLVHDALICPKDKEQETLDALNDACAYYGVMGGAEIEQIEKQMGDNNMELLKFEKPPKKIKPRRVIDSDGITRNQFLKFTDEWFDSIVDDDIYSLLDQYHDKKGEDLDMDFGTLFDSCYSVNLPIEIDPKIVKMKLMMYITKEIDSVIAHNKMMKLKEAI